MPYKGETVELTLRIENFGDGSANAVKVYVDHPFQGMKESFIGTLDPNEDGPAVITFIADRAGEYEFPITITYSDDFGKEQINTKVNLIVLETKGGIGHIILILFVLVIIGGLIYYNYRTKKAKDKIIRQLMKGNNKSAKKKR